MDTEVLQEVLKRLTEEQRKLIIEGLKLKLIEIRGEIIYYTKQNNNILY